ncbi:MAG: hypothetical protein RSE13_05005 [Planktothrix sp. GU0601_MAG3]|nr:MAG: hypothetical protein RSE13_05005 [Planktothrix sp. GU0601_MAG3]
MMKFEQALAIADTLVVEKTGKHLTDAQTAVLQGTWHCQKYHEIALEYRCTPEYLKQDVGPKLWKLLSDELGEKVGKKNFRAVIERLSSPTPPPDPQPTPESLVSPTPAKKNIDWGEAPDVSQFLWTASGTHST